MNNKFIIISICTIVASFATGWELAVLDNEYKQFRHITQAIPVIRFERFDRQRNAFIIGLFNPGTLPMEINRTELSFQKNDKFSGVVFSHHEYGKKPLVLDPEDTILVPLQKKQGVDFQTANGSYWGELYFQIPSQTDFYSLHHKFSKIQLDNVHNFLPAKNP